MSVPLFDPAGPLRPLQPALRAAVAEVLDSEHYILGSQGTAFEQEFAAYVGTAHAAGVANGTEAITIALRALGVGPGDEVVVPSFTFWASAEAIPPTGAVPVFCDVDPVTMCVTEDTVKAALTPRTKAVIAVHLFGNVAPVAQIAALGVPVLEDSAQSAGSTAADGRRPGALGSIATFSFYPSKNLGAFGDGGAITTDDAELDARVRTLRFHGSRDKVTYTEVGYNSRLDELQAAILRVQLPALDGWAAHRAQVAEWYREDGLGELVTLPTATATAGRVAWHLHVVGTEQPDALAAQLTGRGVGARGYYRLPVHRQPAVERLLADGTALVAPGGLPGTDEAAARHLALPISAATTREQVTEVVAAVREGLAAL